MITDIGLILAVYVTWRLFDAARQPGEHIAVVVGLGLGIGFVLITAAGLLLRGVS
jgi:hypothetical protein